ncbi:uncharacterized protein LOC142587514 isoform X3 [Dermacentor variabilis]|uniref:uncharacterized protein LOC142587514 isoform X3 n=1 Tax=Dermacentor variabilis TaxID=34621 RepID=UPI003F5B77EF
MSVKAAVAGEPPLDARTRMLCQKLRGGCEEELHVPRAAWGAAGREGVVLHDVTHIVGA